MTDFIGHEHSGSVPPSASSQSRSWVEVTALVPRGHRVRLGGFFGPAFMANLCQGLAAQRISIERAHAMRARNGSWLVELHVQTLEGALDPSSLPYIALAESTRTHVDTQLTLDEYELVQSVDHGGTLKLTLEAADALGLLGALLAQIAGLSLFPIEMHIDTRAGRAHDCFWLRAMGEDVPSVASLHALDRVLSTKLRRVPV